jgi:hypothetical protein
MTKPMCKSNKKINFLLVIIIFIYLFIFKSRKILQTFIFFIIVILFNWSKNNI